MPNYTKYTKQIKNSEIPNRNNKAVQVEAHRASNATVQEWVNWVECTRLDWPDSVGGDICKASFSV